MALETLHTERMSKVQFGGRLERGKERTHLQRRVTVDFLSGEALSSVKC